MPARTSYELWQRMAVLQMRPLSPVAHVPNSNIRTESHTMTHPTITKELAVKLAREAGFKASIGKTDKEGKYHPNVNALGKDVPIEWVLKLTQAAYKLGRNAGLEEATREIEQANEDRQLYVPDCIDVIESLKDNTP